MLTASLFGLSATQALVVLFVVLPFVVAVPVFLFVSWRSAGHPVPVRTSEILASGLPGRAEVIAVRSLGTILDVRPMVRFDLRVTAGGRPDPFDLEVVQSLPRSLLGQFRSGDTVEVRLTPDLSRGAVVWNHLAPG